MDGSSTSLGSERRAVILAGGPGTRIPPHVTAFPKPLVPVGDEFAVIDVVLQQLSRQGFDGVTIAVGNLGALVRAYCADGEKWNIPIDYWTEAEPLGTIGPIVANLDRVGEHMLVMNGDVLTDLDFADMLDNHRDSGASLTVATAQRVSKIDYGVLETDGSGRRIVSFWEKPERTLTVSTGVYALSKHILSTYVPGRPLGFDELVLDLIAKGEYPTAQPYDGLFLDLGRSEDYEQANAEWPQLAELLFPDTQVRD